ncbi:MAG: agmatinase family protein [Myxococcales bacterium]|nr:agmatinase family protein [Myxococcales bacterium]
MSFDPNAPAARDSGLFGLPYTPAEAKLWILPVPWEATTSYGGGTSKGPAAILEASKQVDLYDLDVDRPYLPGIVMLEAPTEIAIWNEEGKACAKAIIDNGGDAGDDPELLAALARVNELSVKVNHAVYEASAKVLAEGKILGLVGGDHSVPLGAIKALAKAGPTFGVLHVDAHSDTRDAYEGFAYSHASIMRNVLEEVPEVEKLVQIGIRDMCEEEAFYCEAKGERVRTFTDRAVQRRKLRGEAFARIADDVVAALPSRVWISFDVDGLDPRYCPHTGTPVPGGLDLAEVVYLMAEVVRSGRTIVGFDLNEVAPGPDGDEWDANVGARLLYKLAGFTFASQGLAKLCEG